MSLHILASPFSRGPQSLAPLVSWSSEEPHKVKFLAHRGSGVSSPQGHPRTPSWPQLPEVGLAPGSLSPLAGLLDALGVTSVAWDPHLFLSVPRGK